MSDGVVKNGGELGRGVNTGSTWRNPTRSADRGSISTYLAWLPRFVEAQTHQPKHDSVPAARAMLSSTGWLARESCAIIAVRGGDNVA